LVLGNLLLARQAIGIIQAAYAFGGRYPWLDLDYCRTAPQNPQRMAFSNPRHHLLSNLEYNAWIRVGILF
jgi:hypothetical protein